MLPARNVQQHSLIILFIIAEVEFKAQGRHACPSTQLPCGTASQDVGLQGLRRCPSPFSARGEVCKRGRLHSQ